MSTPDPMPSDFGLKYIFWVSWRWVYYNPLTLLFIAQGWAVELAIDYPAIKWISHIASGIGIVIAQIRNRGKDYTTPISKPKETP